MKNRALYLENPYQVVIRDEEMKELSENEVLVESVSSAISAGTELLFYRGQVPAEICMDDNFNGMKKQTAYPLKYGYSAVGRIVKNGAGVSADWIGKRVFSFHPHESRFIQNISEVFPIPYDIQDDDALFLPNMETAVNLVMDGNPTLGESVCVIGLGVVGILTSALLSKIPLLNLTGIDPYKLRRDIACQIGLKIAAVPEDAAPEMSGNSGFDQIYEISGNPEAIDLAVRIAGFGAKIIAGSWYGTKSYPIHLGGRFHRMRLQILSSQVSTIPDRFSGRWDKKRRIDFAWRMIREIQPSQLISHRFSLDGGSEAFELLDRRPEESLQVVFDY